MTPLVARLSLNLSSGCSSAVDRVVNVLSSLVRALDVAGPWVERAAAFAGEAPLIKFVCATRQGAMHAPRHSGEWRRSNVLLTGAPLRSEHDCPLNLLSRDQLAAETTVEAFGRIVADRLLLADITIEEDVRLGATGLSRFMPAAWDRRDPFDRYRAAGLDVAAFPPRQP